MSNSSNLLQVTQISKAFGANPVLHDVSFHADQGEIVCLLGPSGCGKTTLLRIVAGLEAADMGEVAFEGHALGEAPVHIRGFGLMFQDLALFPHRDVAANVAFGLRMQGAPQPQIQYRVAEMLHLVGLEGYEHRRVFELSGGEQQRVALARSLAPGPRLLMLDEPLGSLDRALREELMNELRVILKRVGVTSLYVTHDQQEAFALADRILIMRRGQIVQRGTPQEVYSRPASAWVAQFLGLTNLIPGQVVDVRSGAVEIDTALGRLAVPDVDGEKWVPGQEVQLLIRPEAAQLAAQAPGQDGIPVEGIVQQSSFRGSFERLVLRSQAGLELTLSLVAGPRELPRRGAPIALILHPEALSLLAKEPKAF